MLQTRKVVVNYSRVKNFQLHIPVYATRCNPSLLWASKDSRHLASGLVAFELLKKNIENKNKNKKFKNSHGVGIQERESWVHWHPTSMQLKACDKAHTVHHTSTVAVQCSLASPSRHALLSTLLFDLQRWWRFMAMRWFASLKRIAGLAGQIRPVQSAGNTSLARFQHLYGFMDLWGYGFWYGCIGSAVFLVCL